MPPEDQDDDILDMVNEVEAELGAGEDPDGAGLEDDDLSDILGEDETADPDPDEDDGKADGGEGDDPEPEGSDPIDDSDSGVQVGGGRYTSIRTTLMPVDELEAAPGFREPDSGLVDSIKANGVLVPLTVHDGKVHAGRRRLVAAKEAGLEKVPVNVVTVEDDNVLPLVALVDNLHREDLDPIEEAKAYQSLIDEKIVQSKTALAKALGVSKSVVTKKIAILDLDERIQAAVSDGRIAASVAYELKGVDDDILDKILTDVEQSESATVRKLRKLKKGEGSSDDGDGEEEDEGSSDPKTRVPIPASELPDDVKVMVRTDGITLTIDIHGTKKTWKDDDITGYLESLKKDLEGVGKKITTLRKGIG